ncbi:reductase, leaf isozyme 2, chloroplastic [Seminavis robusta]|uniref:ferredoxin--NADP(+) reductase n=1 Tax=Seminavis robusta TaxID=568900 RepID=A0A9N8EKS7_9STRA|nr:reductase, leaf isozyme 2, chloroplastic [Seminavis robusta]|eukprot:Sro1433_g272270.1 reductase, leaf isozyme 2, chloroplastic (600) ;mRNA; r:24345-26368
MLSRFLFLGVCLFLDRRAAAFVPQGRHVVSVRPTASPRLTGAWAPTPAKDSQLSMKLRFGGGSNQVSSTMIKKSTVSKVLSRVALAFLAIAMVQMPLAAHAAKKAKVVEHLHTGQKVANFFRTFGIPDLGVLAIISALPVVELRGAVPVGIWMGYPITTVLPVCVLGNMAPIIPLLYLLRNPTLKNLMAPILKRAEKKAAGLGVGSLEKQWASLAAFVGIPLPGTGAWTGAMGAFLLGMPTAVALSSIFTGVVSAGVIMSAITLAGRKGGLAALAALFAFTGKEFLFGSKKQDFLEADPYWDQSTVPVNVYKNKAPFTGKVVSTKRIVGPKATGETCHIIIDHKGDFPYWEGQSWGVIPPGVREKDGKPHSVRLYSIASSRYGDDMTGNTGSLCVRRATYWCPELKADDPAKKGICSNFLCDTKAGDEVQMTGPAGKVMLMPEEDPSTDYIMVATGTGIAPYRGFVRRLFTEKTPAAEAYKGQAWLFLGVANSDALLYDDEWQEVKTNNPEQFRLDYALSREQNNAKGGKMYIQDKVEEYADEVFEKLENGAHIYFCGLKGMMPGIQGMLKGVAEKKGLEYDAWLKGLKAKKQWHVEVY